MIQYQHPCTGILEEYPRDRLRTRDHFTLPSKAYLHTIIIIIIIVIIIKIMLLVAEKLSHVTCCLLLFAHSANFAAYLLLTLKGL